MVKKNTKLELTWIGKEERPRLEPRILLEEAERSYHAAHRVKRGPQITQISANSNPKNNLRESAKSADDVGDIFDNRLIFGDNLLALKAPEVPESLGLSEDPDALTPGPSPGGRGERVAAQQELEL
jgi:adenine-specific DNA-methyltransferase